MSALISLFLLLIICFTTFEAYINLSPKRAVVKSFALCSVGLEDRRVAQIDSFDYMSENKLPWQENGYKSWKWGVHNINYVDVGRTDKYSKPPLLLIHGFGASVYHWRYNIPVLARDYHVYAIDLLGLGLSDKPIVEYSAELWRDQVLSFIEEVIKPQTNMPCVVAGNSIGGFTALYAAATPRAVSDGLINGCVLLNAAGRFRSSMEPPKADERPQWLKDLSVSFQKFLVGLTFIYTKQPARIAQVLRQVYPVDAANVDDELVESIRFPAQNPNAPEVRKIVLSYLGLVRCVLLYLPLLIIISFYSYFIN